MAKVLLCTAKPPEGSPFFTTEKRPPVGLLTLASVLSRGGHQVFFLDNYARPGKFIEEGYLQKNKIEFVGVYCNTICWRDCNHMLTKIKHLNVSGKHKCKVIVGGPHVSVNFESILTELCDYIVQGEGENVICDIVDGKYLDQKVISASRLRSLENLPFPAWEFIKGDVAYNWSCVFFPETPVFPLNTSRGCPFDCSFCSVSGIWGKKYVAMSAKKIYAEVQEAIKHGAKGIYFREDNFTHNKRRVDDFCKLLKDTPIPWACESRVDTLEKRVLSRMAQSGCKGLYLGVESGSDKILATLNKGIRVAKTKEVFKACKELGIKTACSMIYGVPGETEDDVQKSKELLAEIKPDIVWNNVFVGLPGSELYQQVYDSDDYEFKDDRGIIYLKGHNERVNRFYGSHPLKWTTVIPPIRKTSPLISVVMSALNCENYIMDAVKSILNQSYQNFEVLIVDDCSTDKTGILLEELAKTDKRIKVFKNPYTCGLTKNLNNLIKTAKGKYIARMDADDISLPNRFEVQVEFLERNPDYAAIGSSYFHINERGHITNWINVMCIDPSIHNGLKNQNWFAHGSVMMNKAMAMNVGLYDEAFKYAQDYDLWVRLAQKYKLSNTEVPYYSYRIRPENISIKNKAEQDGFALRARLKARSIL